MAKQQ
jgi:hypothetical protein